jgi:hypothetical protein
MDRFQRRRGNTNTVEAVPENEVALRAGDFVLEDEADPTKRVTFDVSDLPSGATSVFAPAAVTQAITFVIDGGGTTITTGLKGLLQVPFAATITAARLAASDTGSIQVDIWKESYANLPPDDNDSITNVTPLVISSGLKTEDTTLDGWTTAISAGDWLAFNVDTIATFTQVTVTLTVTRSL